MAPSAANPRWEEVVGAAERQFGVIAHAQVLALDCSPGWIKHRVRRGLLRPLHRGVYAVGHAALGREGQWLGGALAVGAGAVLSHRTAAAIHGMAVEEAGAIELSSIRSARSRPGLAVHRTRTLSAADVDPWHGVRVTRPERTLIDLADVLGEAELVRATDALRRIDSRRLAAALRRAGPSRKGHTALRPVLEPGPRTRSELERAFRRLCRRSGLPAPLANVWVGGRQVDAYWPEHALVVECDSRRWHGSWAARRTDHARDAELQLAGLTVVRITWTEVCHLPHLGEQRIRPFLDGRGLAPEGARHPLGRRSRRSEGALGGV